MWFIVTWLCVNINSFVFISLYPWQINCTLLIWFITFHVTLSHELQIQHEKYIVLYFLYILMKIKSIFLPNSHYCNAKNPFLIINISISISRESVGNISLLSGSSEDVMPSDLELGRVANNVQELLYTASDVSHDRCVKVLMTRAKVNTRHASVWTHLDLFDQFICSPLSNPLNSFKHDMSASTCMSPTHRC